MTSNYETQFGRPLPEAYEERRVCAACRAPKPGECECTSSVETVITQRKDGKQFTKDDLKALFPERYK
jgi:hypothetical protein